jgi:hypothetical protein
MPSLSHDLGRLSDLVGLQLVLQFCGRSVAVAHALLSRGRSHLQRLLLGFGAAAQLRQGRLGSLGLLC